MSNAVSRGGEGLGDDQGRAIGGDGHAVGEGDRVGHLAAGAVGEDHRDEPGSGANLEVEPAAHVEVDVVHVGVASGADDDFVPAQRRDVGEVGVGRERSVVGEVLEPGRCRWPAPAAGVQSKQKGNDVDRASTPRAGRRRRVPVSSTLRISPATQSEHQKRPSCQRADSPMARSVRRVVSSVIARLDGSTEQESSADVHEQVYRIAPDSLRAASWSQS